MRFSLGIAILAIATIASLPVQAQDRGKGGFEKLLESLGQPIQIQESKPVVVKDARFVSAIQTNWRRVWPGVEEIAMQLRITNTSKNEVLFPTFQTHGIRISDAQGKEIKPHNPRRGKYSTRPALLRPGASYVLAPRAEFRGGGSPKTSELVYYDGTGSQSEIGPLPPGRYKLVFWYSAAAHGAPSSQKTTGPSQWSGEATTHEVLFEISDEGPRRGLPARLGKPLKGMTAPRRIDESKPMTVNHAKFVVVAETVWKVAESEADMPIEIQLHLTNLANSDLVFNTFDSFGLLIKRANGTVVRPFSAGRDATVFTRPILLKPRGSFAICRRAELRWDADSQSVHMSYWDGTGSWAGYNLEPRAHTLSFYYGALWRKAQEQDQRVISAAPWRGEATTNELAINVEHKSR